MKNLRPPLFFIISLVIISLAPPVFSAPANAAADTKEIDELKAQNGQLRADKKGLEEANAKLRKINTQLESKAKALFLDTREKEQLKEQVKQLNKAAGVLATEHAAMVRTIERLQANVADLKLENASLYAKAGDAYMRAGLADEAVKSLNDSLRLNPHNAEAHYKLGFLYKRSENNRLKAAYHFKKYLALEPKAKNRKEVKYLIEMLTQYEWK
jgi:tetratricopeptide (TPR) repeat protein